MTDVGSVIRCGLWARLKDVTLQHAVQVHRKQLHAFREDELKVTRSWSAVLLNKLMFDKMRLARINKVWYSR